MDTEQTNALAAEIENYFDRLWPICRSLTGDGVRESLSILGEILPLQVHEVPTGTQVLDWEVPREWNIRDAYIMTPDGRRICNFSENNLHVVNYSVPVDREISFEELDQHLYSLPTQPRAIPYVTSYYRENWGFCLTHEERLRLSREGMYRVMIDSILAPGHLTYADAILQGETDREIFFSSYVCHPSMANNELSGPLVLAFLYRAIAALPNRRYTYRFLLAPETIGAITYLSIHGMDMKERTEAGCVITCAGTDSPPVYKRSRQGNSLTDRAAEQVLKHSGKIYRIDEFEPAGSDERQFCSPGYNLPVGSLMRSRYWDYPEYHTSLDNKSLISFEAMTETVNLYLDLVKTIELNETLVNTVLYGEPQLGKRGLYPSLAGAQTMPPELMLRLRLLNFMDGSRSLLEFAEKYGYALPAIENEIITLKNSGLLKSC